MKNIIKRIIDFFLKDYRKNYIEKKITNHIGIFLNTNRLTLEVSEIEVELIEAVNTYKVNVYCSKPGKLIGRQGCKSSRLAKELSVLSGARIDLNIVKTI